jgi:hypothetical protein
MIPIHQPNNIKMGEFVIPTLLSFTFGDSQRPVDRDSLIKEASSSLLVPVGPDFDSESLSFSPPQTEFTFPKGFSTDSEFFGDTGCKINVPSLGTEHWIKPNSQQLTKFMKDVGDRRSRSERSPSPNEGPVKTKEVSRIHSQTAFRRRRGRPRRGEGGLPNSSYSVTKLRRQIHNDSAMRSRARFNEALEKLWETIPDDEIFQRLGNVAGEHQNVYRADQVEVAMQYIMKLKEMVARLDGALARLWGIIPDHEKSQQLGNVTGDYWNDWEADQLDFLIQYFMGAA